MTAIATQPKKQAAALVPQSDLDQIAKLDDTSRAANAQLLQAELSGNDMAKGLIMARAIRLLRGLLTPQVLADVMELQGTMLGFRTDRDRDGGYKQDEVRDVLVQALIRGLRPTGNEFNIIAGNLYVTKEGFARLLREFPGLTNLSYKVGVHEGVGDKGVLVPCEATWMLDGVPGELLCKKTDDADYRIAIRVNAGMGADAIHGKAESKLLRRIYKQITGTSMALEGDDEPADVGGTPAIEAPKQ